MTELGPVDYLIVAFPGNDFKGEIVPAISDLVDAGTVRIIDVTFVGKSADGEIVMVELLELAPDVQEAFAKLGAEVSGLFSDDDLRAVAEGLEPNSSAALLVWENVWAREVAQAIRNANGVLVDFQRVPHAVVQAARDAVLEAAEA